MTNSIMARPITKLTKPIAVILIALSVLLLQPFIPGVGELYFADAANTTVTASGVTTDYVHLRKSASTSSPSLGVLGVNTKLTITKEVFTTPSSTAATKRWYAVKVGNKSGYIRADLVRITKYAAVKAKANDYLNYRTGAGTQMARKGTLSKGKEITLRLSAQAVGSKDMWYRIRVDGYDYYATGAYLNIVSSGAKKTTTKATTNTTSKTTASKTTSNVTRNKTVAKNLLAKQTSGGRERIVYTFNTNNCKKKFGVTGYGSGMVPQGMAYTGNEYHILFGMAYGQSIVTYSSSGKRLKAVSLPYNIGKPNAITWNPKTRLCYIFIGSQKKIYTWNPSNNKLGTAYTPYSSSGIAYDRSTKKMYASSLTGLRVYSGDGKFRHEKFFDRCVHSATTYIQDCGAHGGYIFHVMSGSNKFGDNYLDVYKASTGKYLGTIKLQLQSEVESVIVANDGFVELLVNNGGTYDECIWRTPLNVNDL